MLTKEQIKEFMDGPGGWPVMLRNREDTEPFRELCRLALLGLERDERAEELRVNVGIAITLFSAELGCAPTSGDILAAIESLKAARDERAEKIGRAVLGSGITRDIVSTRIRSLRDAIGSLRLSSPSGGRTLEPELRMYEAIATALEAP